MARFIRCFLYIRHCFHTIYLYLYIYMLLDTRKDVIGQPSELQGEGYALLGSCQSREKDFK